MTMSPQDRAIARLTGTFGEPRTPDPEIFLEEFAKAISGWSLKVLDKACDEVIRTSTFWPKPAEIIEKCKAIAEEMNPRHDKTYYFPSRRAPYDAKTEKAWDDAKAWRTQVCAQYGSMDEYYAATRNMPRISQFATEAAPKPKPKTLSAVSRRITGEHDG